MIPKENIYKETTISFKGQLVPFDYIIHSLTSCKITRNEAATILNDLRGFFENNIIFPLSYSGSNLSLKDQKGCRIHDWKILTTPQIKNMMKIKGKCEYLRVPRVPISNFFAQETMDDAGLMPVCEVYNKFLNVTYLVDDEFLQEWCNPYYFEKNIAKKQVEDCSVRELLFAVKNKLNGEKQ